MRTATWRVLAPVLALVVVASLGSTPAFGQDSPCKDSPCKDAPCKDAACSGATCHGSLYQPSAGDVLLFRNDSIVMNALTACTLSVGTTHVGIVVKRRDDSFAILEIPHARARVQFREIHQRITTYPGQVAVRRPLRPLSEYQSANLTEFAYANLGKGYDLLGILALPFSLPIRLQNADDPLRQITEPSRWFCASLTVASCCIAGQLDPAVANPWGACADDLRGDLILDLSASYGPPVGLRADSP